MQMWSPFRQELLEFFCEASFCLLLLEGIASGLHVFLFRDGFVNRQ